MNVTIAAIAAALVGGLLGYAVGQIRGFNRGFSMLKATESVQKLDRLTVHLSGRCELLRGLKDDMKLGLPTRRQSLQRLNELQALSLVVFTDPSKLAEAVFPALKASEEERRALNREAEGSQAS